METHILIPTHNRTKLIADCLESMQKQAAAYASVTAIWVIENGSAVAKDIVAEYKKELPLKYLHFAEGNKSKALNRALEEIPAEALLIFFDDDVLVDRYCVESFQTAAEVKGDGHYFGGVVRPNYEQPPEPSLVNYLPSSGRLFDLSAGEQYRVFTGFQLFLGANWACYASDIRKIGGFSAAYGPGAKFGVRGQEGNAQFRLTEVGVKPVFVKSAIVDHFVSKHMVSKEWVIDRIFKSVIQKGQESPSFIHSAGLLVKMIYSLLLLPLQPNNIGHLYRINKASGYFYGLVKRYLNRK